MALFDLRTDDVVDFVKFLITKGANVNTSDLNGDTPLHLLASYSSKLSHEEHHIKENVDKEDDNLIQVIKLLLANGANLAAKNNND
jgi:ankyrin repeat protein